MPTIPAPSFKWLYDTKKPGPLPELKASATATVSWQAQVGKRGPGILARRAARRRFTPRPRTARSSASIPPTAAASGASAPARSSPPASARTRRWSSSAPTRAKCSRFFPTASRRGRRAFHRGRRAAARGGWRRHRVHRRRQHARAERGRRHAQVGQPARRRPRSSCAITRAASSRAAACSSARPAATCSRWTCPPASSAGTPPSPIPKGATELERIADVTSLPLVLETRGVRGRLSGPRRVLRPRSRHAATGRATSPA